MRWVVLIILFVPVYTYAIDINRTDAINESIEDPDSFRFFYVGHAYGAHNGGGGKKGIVYPHPELIRQIEQLKKYDFGVFGGDVVEVCNKRSVQAFEDFFIKPLGIPLLNSMGNHDGCLMDVYNFPELQVFNKASNTFIVINSANRRLEEKIVDWLYKELGKFNSNDEAKRLFIFTHRPTFLLLDPALKNATRLGNFSVNPDKYFTDAIRNVILDMGPGKSVYWFAGDLGMRIPYIYRKLGDNVSLIGSGVYERDSDHYLDVSVKSGKVEIKTINLIAGKSGELIDFTSPEFIAKKLPANALEEGWTETLLAKLYSSVDSGEQIKFKASNVENESKKAFNLNFLPASNSILLRKEDCGPSGDLIFFVQFHPARVEDRRIRARQWNGYHFYASKVGKTCIATFPLPDYPFKFILTGQLDSGDILWKAKILKSDFTSKSE